MTVEEYLRRERTETERHEYQDGNVRLLEGSNRAESLISANLIGELGNALKEYGGQVYDGSLKVRIEAFNSILYPNLSVTCAPIEAFDEDEHVVLNPQVIVEVLSPSSSSYDRGKKFIQYQSLPSLMEYVVVEQMHPQVDVYRRTDQGWGQFRNFVGLESFMVLESLGISIPLTEIYALVQFKNDLNSPQGNPS